MPGSKQSKLKKKLFEYRVGAVDRSIKASRTVDLSKPRAVFKKKLRTALKQESVEAIRAERTIRNAPLIKKEVARGGMFRGDIEHAIGKGRSVLQAGVETDLPRGKFTRPQMFDADVQGYSSEGGFHRYEKEQVAPLASKEEKIGLHKKFKNIKRIKRMVKKSKYSSKEKGFMYKVYAKDKRRLTALGKKKGIIPGMLGTAFRLGEVVKTIRRDIQAGKRRVPKAERRIQFLEGMTGEKLRQPSGLGGST